MYTQQLPGDWDRAVATARRPDIRTDDGLNRENAYPFIGTFFREIRRRREKIELLE